MILHILQDVLPPPARLDPHALELPRVPLGLPDHPPRVQHRDAARSDEHLASRKGGLVLRRVLVLEDLRADGVAHLAVAVDEADREGGAGGARCRLGAPWPH